MSPFFIFLFSSTLYRILWRTFMFPQKSIMFTPITYTNRSEKSKQRKLISMGSCLTFSVKSSFAIRLLIYKSLLIRYHDYIGSHTNQRIQRALCLREHFQNSAIARKKSLNELMEKKNSLECSRLSASVWYPKGFFLVGYKNICECMHTSFRIQIIQKRILYHWMEVLSDYEWKIYIKRAMAWNGKKKRRG